MFVNSSSRADREKEPLELASSQYCQDGSCSGKEHAHPNRKEQEGTEKDSQHFLLNFADVDRGSYLQTLKALHIPHPLIQ